ncbi:Cytochrome c oxidase subunit 5A [Podila humilis]|nr:Cytochrome c oxidase subunit 5A [Podila humilis]
MNRLVRPAIRVSQRRCISSSSSSNTKSGRVVSFTPTPAAASEIPLTNLSLRWKTLTHQEKEAVTKSLEQVQTGDWKAMTLEQKKAAYWVAFGAHGARTPLTGPGHAVKVFAGTAGVLAVSVALFQWMRAAGGEQPRTKTKEWQEATDRYARENKINPISGISSEGYKGQGFTHLAKD